MELRIPGKETALEDLRNAITKINGLAERWDVVCRKLRVSGAYIGDGR